ncbi:MAG: DUF3054 domain-containing protein [Halanaeroarchaeum sp.]
MREFLTLAAEAPAMRFDVNRSALVRYGLGDVAVIVAFVAIGEVAHGSNPLAVLSAFAQTSLTFLVGWAIAAPAIGAYRSQTLTSWRFALGLPVLAWALADGVGQLLRSTAYFEGSAAASFYLVALVAGGALLAVWRAIAFRLAGE